MRRVEQPHLVLAGHRQLGREAGLLLAALLVVVVVIALADERRRRCGEHPAAGAWPWTNRPRPAIRSPAGTCRTRRIRRKLPWPSPACPTRTQIITRRPPRSACSAAA